MSLLRPLTATRCARSSTSANRPAHSTLTVLWLDDLEPFLNDGVTLATLREWHGGVRGRIVAATYGGKGSERIAGLTTDGLTTIAAEVLQNAREIPMTPTTTRELGALRARISAEQFASLERHGLAAYLVAAPQLERSEDELAVYDDVVARLGAATEPALRELVAGALFNKGVALGALEHSEDELAVYDDVVARLGRRDRTSAARAGRQSAVQQGVRLGRWSAPRTSSRCTTTSSRAWAPRPNQRCASRSPERCSTSVSSRWSAPRTSSRCTTTSSRASAPRPNQSSVKLAMARTALETQLGLITELSTFPGAGSAERRHPGGGSKCSITSSGQPLWAAVAWLGGGGRLEAAAHASSRQTSLGCEFSSRRGRRSSGTGRLFARWARRRRRSTVAGGRPCRGRRGSGGRQPPKLLRGAEIVR